MAHREEMKAKNLAHYHSLTPEQKEARRAKARETYNALPEEEKQRRRDMMRFYRESQKKGNEWMLRMPSLTEIRHEWKRCEKEIQYVTVPTIDM